MTGAARTGFPDLRDRKERKVTGIVRKRAWAGESPAKEQTGRRADCEIKRHGLFDVRGIGRLEFSFLSSWAWRKQATGELLLGTYIVVVRTAAPGDGALAGVGAVCLRSESG